MIQISEATSEDAAPHHLPFVPKKSMDLEEESYDNAMGGEMMRWVESHGGWRCDASPLRPSPLQHGRCEMRRPPSRHPALPPLLATVATTTTTATTMAIAAKAGVASSACRPATGGTRRHPRTPSVYFFCFFQPIFRYALELCSSPF
jgi:hypothetical protein